ncbi:MAG: XRE family transcriptional regulator [Neptuniibacter sp.]
MSSIAYNNIFEAVTDNKEEASELQNCSSLIIAIRENIELQGWTQDEAAKQLGLSQPRVSDLINGKIESFSIELLMSCLHRLDFRLGSV